MGAFGCFEGIDLLLVVGGCAADMGSQIAMAGLPLGGRLGAGTAEPAGVEFNLAAAAVTGFHGFVTNAAVVRATNGGHERTFLIFTNGCTKQGYHLLRDILKQKGRDNTAPGLMHVSLKPPEPKLFTGACQLFFWGHAG
jgi:hypothetical protein